MGIVLFSPKVIVLELAKRAKAGGTSFQSSLCRGTTSKCTVARPACPELGCRNESPDHLLLGIFARLCLVSVLCLQTTTTLQVIQKGRKLERTPGLRAYIRQPKPLNPKAIKWAVSPERCTNRSLAGLVRV